MRRIVYVLPFVFIFLALFAVVIFAPSSIKWIHTHLLFNFIILLLILSIPLVYTLFQEKKEEKLTILFWQLMFFPIIYVSICALCFLFGTILSLSFSL